MKILLIGNYQPDAIYSMEKFATMLQTYLPQFGHQVSLIRPQPWLGNLQFPPLIRKWLGYIDKLILFVPKLHQALSWADVVHICDHGNAVYTSYLQTIPHIVTCHDLLAIRAGLGEFPEYQTGWTGKQLQKMIIHGLSYTQKVVCVSEQTRKDVMRLCLLSSNAVSVIPLGLNYPYSPIKTTETNEYLDTLGISPNSCFFLHVGANHWYKNRLGVLAIFHHLILKLKQTNLYLLMVGSPFTQEMNEFIKAHNLQDNIRELTDINCEFLRALYSSAKALIFPSLQEGFGWPIIEAQACGCPVFTSNRLPMTEIGGEAAIYIEPNHYEQAAETIIEFLSKLESFKSKGIANAQKFSTEKMILEYITLYQQAINEKSLLS